MATTAVTINLYVSYFAQTLDGRRGKQMIIDTRSQRVINKTGAHPGVRVLAPKHVGRKEIPCKYLQFCKENR
jgi:hypothetical protein